jgi:hypothetical protein
VTALKRGWLSIEDSVVTSNRNGVPVASGQIDRR